MQTSLILLLLASFFHQAQQPGGTIVIPPYVQNVRSDGFTICWETSEKTPSWLQWGTAADCPMRVEDGASSRHHEVVLHDLQPDTTYWVRVANGGDAAAVRTQPAHAEKVRIAVIGDTHSTKTDHALLVRDMIAADPQLVLHTGDLALSSSDRSTRDFFEVEASLLRSVPLLPVLGSHDDGARFDRLFPQQHPAKRAHYYVERFGPVAIISVDTDEPVGLNSRQRRWIEETLRSLAAEPSIVFRIVAMHWGPFDSGSGHGSNDDVRESLVPLFENYRVDVVFSGHDHVYERSAVNGVRYVVTGGGGGMAGNSGMRKHIVLRAAWTEASATAHHFCLVEIEGGALRLTAREVGSGRILDEFSLASRAAAPGDEARSRSFSPAPAEEKVAEGRMRGLWN